MRFDVLVEIFLAVIIRDLLAGADGFDGEDVDAVADSPGFRVGAAAMVYIACNVFAIGAIYRIAVFDIEQIPSAYKVSLIGGHELSPILNNKTSLRDILRGKETVPSEALAYAQGKLGRSRLVGDNHRRGPIRIGRHYTAYRPFGTGRLHRVC